MTYKAITAASSKDFFRRLAGIYAKDLEEADVYMATGGSNTSLASFFAQYEYLDPGVTYILSDDRDVAPGTEFHNGSKLVQSLGDHGVIEDQILIPQTGYQPSLSVEVFGKSLEKLMENRTYLADIAFLGIGPDLHIAGILPLVSRKDDTDTYSLYSSNQLAGFVEGDLIKAPFLQAPDRITVTLEALKHVKKIIFVLGGVGKKTVFEACKEAEGTPLGDLLQIHDQVEIIWGDYE